jgi:hypothetical protein
LAEEKIAEQIQKRLFKEVSYKSSETLMVFNLLDLDKLLGDHKGWKRDDLCSFSLQQKEDIDEAWILRLKFCEETNLSEQLSEELWVQNNIFLFFILFYFFPNF